MKYLLWLLFAVFPTNGPPQSGFDNNGNGHPIYVDPNGNQSVLISSTPALPDAGNSQVPADLANTKVTTTLTLCLSSSTALPATPLVGRKWLTVMNNGPSPIYISSSTTGYGPDGGLNQGMMLVTSQAATFPAGGNINFYCVAPVKQLTPTTLVPNGTTTLEGQ